MNHSITMAIIDGGDDLWKDARRLFLLHPAVRHQVIEDLAATSVLRHEVDGVGRLHDLIETRDVRMVEQLQDGNLPERLGQVVIIEACLVDDLDGNLGRDEEGKERLITTCSTEKNNIGR